MSDTTPRAPDSQEVTMRDIAEHAGVSLATVSRVLNKTVPVARSKRAAVMKAVEELGYRPNVVARELARGRTQAMGVLPQGISNPFYSRLLKGVE
jgi:DNA-binding LacI/PurR family transcriptional regulator